MSIKCIEYHESMVTSDEIISHNPAEKLSQNSVITESDRVNKITEYAET